MRNASRHQRYLTFNAHFRVVLLGAALATLATACAATPTSAKALGAGYVDDSTITAKIKGDLLQDNKLSAADVTLKHTKVWWT
jgi:hypothetical protein